MNGEIVSESNIAKIMLGIKENGGFSLDFYVNEMIEDCVPEESKEKYNEAAKTILEILGDAIETVIVKAHGDDVDY